MLLYWLVVEFQLPAVTFEFALFELNDLLFELELVELALLLLYALYTLFTLLVVLELLTEFEFEPLLFVESNDLFEFELELLFVYEL